VPDRLGRVGPDGSRGSADPSGAWPAGPARPWRSYQPTHHTAEMGPPINRPAPQLRQPHGRDSPAGLRLLVPTEGGAGAPVRL